MCLYTTKGGGGKEGAVQAIRAEGEDGGQAENGVRDTNTGDADTHRCLKIESNYRRGAKRKMRRGGRNEKGGSDECKCVVEE